jgi:hypothetical protein
MSFARISGQNAINPTGALKSCAADTLAVSGDQAETSALTWL